MKTPHKHADLIRAWADGAEIECLLTGLWIKAPNPNWGIDYEYRIKPEPKPDVIYYGTHETAGDVYLECVVSKVICKTDTFKLTFDGTTNKLKSAEVI